MTPHSDPLRVSIRGCVFTAVFLVCMIAVTGPATAGSDGAWIVVWQEDFEDGRADGWSMDTYTRFDTVGLVPSSPGYELFGRSPEYQAPTKRPGPTIENHGGFTAISPDLGKLGLDFRKPYTIEFDYTLPAEHSCFTYVLASRAALLVIDDSDVDAGVGYLAILDHNHANPQRVATLTMGQTVSIKLRANPAPALGLCNYKLFVDGTLVSTGTREDCLTYAGVQVMDLPARITSDPITPPIASPCFGAGSWDNFVVKKLVLDERTGGGRGDDISVEPSPFNPKTSIRFKTERPGHVQVSVFDVTGRLVRVLCDEVRGAGLQVVEWNGRDGRGVDVASGSYLVRVRADGGQAVTRAVLVR